MKAMRNVYKILFGRPEESTPLGEPGHCERIILKWILWK
jgi:hypothetical protein